MRRIVKKSDLIKEGYVKGLKAARQIISRVIRESYDAQGLPVVDMSPFFGKKIKLSSQLGARFETVMDKAWGDACIALWQDVILPIYKSEGVEGLYEAHENGAGITWEANSAKVTLKPFDGEGQATNFVGFHVLEDVAASFESGEIDETSSVTEVFGEDVEIESDFVESIASHFEITIVD